MGSKVASVRLGLDSSGFKRELNSSVAASKAAGTQMGASLRAGLANANKGGLDALKSGAGAVKGALSMVTGVVGTAGLVALAKGAMDTGRTFKLFAQGVERGSGELVDWAAEMKNAQDVSDKLGKQIGTNELGKSLTQLYDASGDLAFARKVLLDVGTAAVASGHDLGQMGNLAGELNEKFGVSADEMKNALNDVLSLSKRGGVEFEELAGYVGQMGAGAKQAGIQGEAGFARFLGMLNAVRDNVGSMKKGISGVQGIIDGLSSGDVAKKAKLQVGVDVASMQKAGASFDKIIATIVAKAKGDTKKLTEIFGSGSQLQAVQAIGSLGSTVEEIQEALDKAGKATVGWEKVQKQAADNAADGPGRLNAAMEEMRRTFEKPEITQAITDLAGNLPKLAQVVSQVLGFMAKNPKTSAALAIGGLYGKGAVGALIEGAMLRGSVGAASTISGGMATGGALAGSAIGAAMATAAAAAAVALAVDQGMELDKEATVRTYDSEGKEVKGARTGYDEMLSMLERDLGELGEMISTGGATTGEAQKAYEQRQGIYVGYERKAAPSYDSAGRRTEWGEKIDPKGREMAKRDAYEREVAMLKQEEDADWNSYAKKNKIDDASLAKPKGGGQQQIQIDPSIAKMFADGVGAKVLKVEVQNLPATGLGAPAPAPRPGHLRR